MNTPLSWIKAYVPELTCTEQEYMDAMTMKNSMQIWTKLL